MLFKYPNLLYALFLVLIPIIVHLFQFRKFKKEAFTNVKFLKKVELQTRKSAQLKKWLVLLTRMLALAAIILAFAQPYIPNSSAALTKSETLIYLDNSFSMQQPGSQGALLQEAVQGLVKNLPQEALSNVFTNDETHEKRSYPNLREDLLNLNYTPTSTSFQEVYVKAKQFFKNKPNTENKLVVISDFQQQNFADFTADSTNFSINFIPVQAKNQQNISIDSVYVLQKDLNRLDISIELSANELSEEDFPVAVTNANTNQLLAKNSVQFSTSRKASITVSLPAQQDLQGKISIEDAGLSYDNLLYFTLQKAKPIQVIAINEGDANYLKRIFDDPDAFRFSVMNANQLDYNQLENADFIILNELKSIPNGLETLLNKHQQENGVTCIVPSLDASINTYENLLAQLTLPKFSGNLQQNLQVTRINFSHPLYENVFQKQVSNFEYPSVSKSFALQASLQAVLEYSNGQAFLTGDNHAYLFSTSLAQTNTNFKNSPLIAPTFYNMAQESLQQAPLYFVLQTENKLDVPVTLPQDHVLSIKSESEEFIPQQQRYSTKVQVNLTDLPEKDGHYSVYNNNEALLNTSFNYAREESNLTYADVTSLPNTKVYETIGEYFSERRSLEEIHELWKWFVIFALILLATEVALLKFLT